jgi:hypothetical protein
MTGTELCLQDSHYSKTDYSIYQIKVDNFTFPGYVPTVGEGQLGGNAIIDSGTISLNAPNDVADAYSKLFNPPAFAPPELGIYITECNAQGPSEPFSVIINGTAFFIPGSAFVLNEVILSENGFPGKYGDYCFSGMQDGGIFGQSRYVYTLHSRRRCKYSCARRSNHLTSYNLGRPFLEEVVAVHDVGAKEMRFAQRHYDY